MSLQALRTAVAIYGAHVAEKFATGNGEPEDHLRTPFENLLADLAPYTSAKQVAPAGEHHLAVERVRPDFAIDVQGATIGYAELKAPGKGADPTKYKGHDREQWERLACLPNVFYSDGQAFALYHFGDRDGDVVVLSGDVETAGGKLTVSDLGLLDLLDRFLGWEPLPPKNAGELALVAARLCRLLRAEVLELMETEEGLQSLAQDWRLYLFPDARDAEFADGYAQTVTFALLLARAEGIEIAGRKLRDVADDLGSSHTLMGQALDLLTDTKIQKKLAISVTSLQRVLGAVDWPTVSKGQDEAWLLFYESFLAEYDPTLRRKTGSYYTPVEVVDPMVRMVDDLLRTRLDHKRGLASPDVTIVDPSAGTGTFLWRIVDRIGKTIEEEEGEPAVGPFLRESAGRLIGFELQAGPYAVAEFRLAAEFAKRGAHLGSGELRYYLTNTLGDPNQTVDQIPATYRSIAISRQRANEVKAMEPVVVVIGNPPYREKSKGLGGWVEAGSPKEKPFLAFMPDKTWKANAHVKHLYNLYVYFWRWASWKVFEEHPGGRGVVAFITVAGFLNGAGFGGMRRHLRRRADKIWVIDCSPEGHQPDVATRFFAGVQQPICITIAVRDGTGSDGNPAEVRYRAVMGRREDKFAALADLRLDDSGWELCPTDWRFPFLPESGVSWRSLPAIEDVFAWSGSGTMPGRTWVIETLPSTLLERWCQLLEVDAEKFPEKKSALLSEHPRDRTIKTVLRDDLPGYKGTGRSIAKETSICVDPTRYAYRSFDRQWIIPDKRVINRPNPSLWQVRNAPGQVYLTVVDAVAPSAGPASTACSVVPDLDHYHGRGGRAWPLWLDAAGTRPNVVPGLLEHLSSALDRKVTGPDLFAYFVAVTASPAYVERFRGDLVTPGLRIPLTADVDLFDRALQIGRRVLWLHTFGESFVDPADGRPATAPRLPAAERPSLEVGIPDTPDGMPATIEYDPATRTLAVGAGRIARVDPGVWSYEISGMKVVKRWFDRRKKEPEGRRSSPLDDIVPKAWHASWTSELLEILNVLTFLIQLELEQDALLGEITAGPLVSVADLMAAGVLPVEKRPICEKPQKEGQLFEA